MKKFLATALAVIAFSSLTGTAHASSFHTCPTSLRACHGPVPPL